MGCFLLKFYTVCLVLLGQSGINSLFLDTQLDGNVLSFLNLSGKKTFSERNSELGIRLQKLRKFLFSEISRYIVYKITLVILFTI